MDPWKVITRIANMFGIVFLAFTVLAAVINYEYAKVFYLSTVPVSLIATSCLMAMLPFLAVAVASLLIANIISRTMRDEAEEKAEEQEETRKTETQSKEEAEFQKMVE